MTKALLLALALVAPAAMAATSEFTLTIRNHRFEPSELRVPKDQKIKLTIDNQDPTPEEFESRELSREKVIPGKSKGVVFVGPLQAGRYPFFGEFHENTAKGVLIAE